MGTIGNLSFKKIDLIERDLPHVLATTFQKTVVMCSSNQPISATKDYVLMSCSATEIPMLRECQAGDEFMAPFSIISKRPRVVCLLDSTCVARWRFDSHGSKYILRKYLHLPL